MYDKLPSLRYKNTLKMLKSVCPSPSVVFDLGVTNPFTEIMKKNDYKVYTTNGEDLDNNPNITIPNEIKLCTSYIAIENCEGK